MTTQATTQTPSVSSERDTFASFSKAVGESIGKHAERKGYARGDDGMRLSDFLYFIGIGRAHACAEIIYKAVEYWKNPRRVMLEKIAGWAYIAWRHTPEGE